MAQYIENSTDKYFTELADDETFQQDLKSFFTGGRYNYTDKEIEEMGYDQLADDFVEHMRFQAVNEATAVKDLLYVKRDYYTESADSGPDPLNIAGPKRNKRVKRNILDIDPRMTRARDSKFRDGKYAFGRLMAAYDNSAGGGTWFGETAMDYIKGFVTSPSTAGTVATLGFGVGSKIAGAMSGQATQLAIRATMAKMLEQGVSQSVVKEFAKKGLTRTALKSGAQSLALEGALGLTQSYAEKETRDTVDPNYNYTAKEVMVDGAIQAAIGLPLGVLGGFMDAKSANKAQEIIFNQVKNGEKTRRKALKSANLTIKNANSVILESSVEDMVEVATLLAAKQKQIKLDPLNPDSVELGDGIRSLILTGNLNQELTTSLNLGTIKGVVAAGIDLKTMLKIKPNQRVSQVLADAIRNGSVTTEAINKIKNKYSLSDEQFSYVFLSDLSRAGKVLRSARTLKDALDPRVVNNELLVKENLKESLDNSLDLLAETRVSSISSIEANSVFEQAASGKWSGVVGTIRELDSLRIGFMTSQLGTTMANVGTGGFNIAVDISDQFWKNVLTSTFGETLPDGTKVGKRWVGGTLSTLRGMTWNRAEAAVLKDMMLADAPVEFTSVFYETVKGMDVSGNKSILSGMSRFVNTLNIATDAVYKEAALYSAVDRRLRQLNNPEIGTNFGEFLTKTKADGSNLTLDDLPPSVMEYAIDSAKRFTFQKDFKKDKSLFGRGARGLQKIHYKLPFIVSVGADVPFPRYIANHLEYISDYSPIGYATGGIEKLEKYIGGFNPVFGDAQKTMTDRGAKAITGAGLFIMGYQMAQEKKGEIDFAKWVQTTKTESDLKRVLGPFAMHALLGDVTYRYMNNLPWNKTATQDNILEIAGGIPDMRTGAFKFEFDLIRNLSESSLKGGATPGLEKQLGDIISTYTYPATFVSSFQGQMDYESAGNPYTRDLRVQDPLTGERNFLMDIIKSDYLKQQATKNLVDWSRISYGQSYTQGKEKGHDVRLYSIFNPNPIGSWNPMTKQFGVGEEPPSTLIQKEMTLLGIRDYKMYSSYTVPNAIVDEAVRYSLSQTMPFEFKGWKETKKHKGVVYLNRTYDQIPNDQQGFELKRKLLTNFINFQINKRSGDVKDAYDALLDDPKFRKFGLRYVRATYDIEQAKFEKQHGNLDKVLKMFPNQFRNETGSVSFTSSKDFIENAGSIAEEMNRRQHLLSMVTEYNKAFESEDLPSLRK